MRRLLWLMMHNKQTSHSFQWGLGPLIFLLALILLPACTTLRTVPIDYQPLAYPQKLGRQPLALKVKASFRSAFEQETTSFSIGNDRFVMKVGESLSAALTEASQAVFQAPSLEAAAPTEAFLEFQLVSAIVDSPKSFLGDITGVHQVKYHLEIKAYLSDTHGKEIWRGTFIAQEDSSISTLFRLNSEKEMGTHLSAAIRKIGNDFIKDITQAPVVAQYIVAAKAAREEAKTKGTQAGTRLGFALRPALAPPARIGVVDLRPVEQEDALEAYDLTRNLRKELTSWGLTVFDPEDTRNTHPEIYAQYWACDNLRCLVQAGRKLGYDFMIYGSVMKFKERYVFTLRLLTTEPQTDPQLKVVSSEGNYQPQELAPALKKLTESLLAAE